MRDGLLTRASLLARLGDPEDRSAWSQFVALYGGLVYGFARKNGVQDADAADLTQEVFLAVAKSIGKWKYEPKRGTFRGWLYGITRNKIAALRQRPAHQPVGAGGTDAQIRLGEVPGDDSDQGAEWEREFQRQAFRLAAEEVKGTFAPSTWTAFWETAVEGRTAGDVGAELGMSVGAVYVARSRVLARLTEQIKLMEAE